ncbi:hypothetical protein [Haloterrigena sp. H1]|uniref:hypothetical protein n=1 Tax=Haloterrigena sp. H1 TaxID=2552943 RepID=UPI0014866982|nr:hypothetical protein [Haloterrigena sp. H1]
MSVKQRSDIIDEEREMARTVAISLGTWLAITVAAVLLLLLFGGPLANLLL